MPGSYTHFAFGQEVYSRVPEDLKIIINKNRTAYNIGLNGPDILFYYKPLFENKIKAYGSKLHEENAIKFFSRAKMTIIKDKSDIGISYILGFVCHFILDSNCHPYISKAEKESGMSHEAIEAELDGFIMRKNGVNPKRQNAGEHVIPRRDISRDIYRFYENVDEEQVYKCLKSVRFYNSFITCSNGIKKKFMKGILKITKGGDSLSDMIINATQQARSKKVVEKLVSIYEDSIIEATKFVSLYYNEIIMDTETNQRFNRNFI